MMDENKSEGYLQDTLVHQCDFSPHVIRPETITMTSTTTSGKLLMLTWAHVRDQGAHNQGDVLLTDDRQTRSTL